jgi:large subunit ribosomal protein L15
LPKFGFTNTNKVAYQVVNLDALEQLTDVETITKDVLYQAKLIRKMSIPVKVLGDGKLERKINVEVDAISKSAREKIEKLGGSVSLA